MKTVYNVRCLLKIDGVIQDGYKAPKEISNYLNKKKNNTKKLKVAK